MQKPPEPTQEEIEKVANWWNWVKVAICDHSSGFSIDGNERFLRCSDCGERLYVMSKPQMTDEQLEEFAEKPDV